MQTGARAAALPALIAVVVGVAGCATVGSGTGSVAPSGGAVNFSWKGSGAGSTGMMTAHLPGGDTYTGPYLQVTHDVRTTDFGPMWIGWPYGWRDWYGWPAFPRSGYATVYSGRVLANLEDNSGQHMRCRFFLNNPGTGMTGGGQGQCQLADGRTIDAIFPPGKVVAAG